MSSYLASSNPHRQTAFTLIELMVVIVLIGILTAMIIPDMRGTFEDALLRSTARRLVDVFNLASSRAIATNQRHYVRLDHQAGQYSIERPVREEEGESGVRLVRDIAGGGGKLDPRISIEVQRPESDPQEAPESQDSTTDEQRPYQNYRGALVFYPDGTALAAVITLQDRQGFRLALRINPITARINIVELERK